MAFRNECLCNTICRERRQLLYVFNRHSRTHLAFAACGQRLTESPYRKHQKANRVGERDSLEVHGGGVAGGAIALQRGGGSRQRFSPKPERRYFSVDRLRFWVRVWRGHSAERSYRVANQRTAYSLLYESLRVLGATGAELDRAAVEMMLQMTPAAARASRMGCC